MLFYGTCLLRIQLALADSHELLVSYPIVYVSKDASLIFAREFWLQRLLRKGLHSLHILRVYLYLTRA
jgi:hypothetical protein